MSGDRSVCRIGTVGWVSYVRCCLRSCLAFGVTL